MTINLPTPKLSIPKVKVTKTAILIAVAVVLFLGILSFAIVKTEQNRLAVKNEAARVAAVQKAESEKIATVIRGLEDKLAASEAKRKAVCDYTLALSKAPATRGRVTTPVLACS